MLGQSASRRQVFYLESGDVLSSGEDAFRVFANAVKLNDDPDDSHLAKVSFFCGMLEVLCRLEDAQKQQNGINRVAEIDLSSLASEVTEFLSKCMETER